MDARVQLERVVCCLIVVGMLMTWPDHARSQGVSDVFSSSDGYDKRSTEAKEKSSYCLSILDEAKAFQAQGLALDEEA